MIRKEIKLLASLACLMLLFNAIWKAIDCIYLFELIKDKRIDRCTNKLEGGIGFKNYEEEQGYSEQC